MNKHEDTELSAIKIAAAASKTPFKMALKATLGVAVGQLIITVIFFGGLGALGILLYLLTT